MSTSEERPEENGFSQCLKIATRRLAVQRAAERGAEAVEELVSRLDPGLEPAWTVRAEAASALGDLGVPEATDSLLSALNDPHPAVRLVTVGALEVLGDSRANPPLR